MLGLAAATALPDDYRGVHEALHAGKPVQADSELGRQFKSLARKIASKQPEPAPGRRFVEYFSLVPRYSFAERK